MAWVRTWGRIAVGGALLVVLVAGLTLTYGVRQHRGIVEEEIKDAFAEAALDAEHGAADMERRLRRYDALHSMARLLTLEMSRSPAFAASALAELRANIETGQRAVEQVAGIGLDGNLLWTTSTNQAGTVNLSDREHFLAIAVGGARVFVGRPVIGRVSGMPTVQYARGIYDADDTLRGVSVVSIGTALMVKDVERGGAEPSRASALLRGDGVLLGVNGGPFPFRVMPADVMREASANGAARGNLLGDDGRRYLTVVRRTDQLGLLLVLTRDMESVIASGEALAFPADIGVAVAGIVLVLGTVLGTILLAVWWKAQGALAARMASEAAMARVRQVTDNIQDVVILWSIEGDKLRYHTVTPSCRKVLDIEPAALEADPSLLRFHPEDLRRAIRATRALAAGGTAERAEYRVFRPDGRMIWLDVASAVLPDGGGPGDQPQYISTFHDVTDRRAGEAQLSAMTRRLEQITEAAPGVLYEIEATWREEGMYAVKLNFLSRAFTRVTGYPMELASQKGGFARIVGPEGAALRHGAISRALREDTASIEYAMVLPDGRTRRMRDTYNLEQRTSEGGVLVCFLTDVTDEALMRDQLGEASKLSFLGEMAAGIAHELHQPLAAIMLQAETLRYEIPPDVANRKAIEARIERLVALTERAANVIRRVRAFSRRDDETPAPFDAVGAVRDGLAMMQARLNDTLVEVSFATGTEPVPVVGHAAPFEQVIMNLVANACDEYVARWAPGQKARSIEIDIARRGGKVQITVVDHAGGIPETVLPRIFEPFYTTKEQGKGTGLGLSICRRIIEDVGGTITAANREDGAVFTITMPDGQAAWVSSAA